LDGLEDAHVAGAAAEVSGEAFFDLVEGGVGVFVEEMMRGEDHAGGADAALRAAFFQEALLDRVKVAVGEDAFDGGDMRVVGLQGGDKAGVDEFSVDEDGAGSALASLVPVRARSSRRTSSRRFIGGTWTVCCELLMVRVMGVMGSVRTRKEFYAKGAKFKRKVRRGERGWFIRRPRGIRIGCRGRRWGLSFLFRP
jgi:hypothetical protein